jgi:hypothetical protein
VENLVLYLLDLIPVLGIVAECRKKSVDYIQQTNKFRTLDAGAPQVSVFALLYQ